MTDLLPCPFCGSKDVVLKSNSKTYNPSWVECHDCFSSGPIIDSDKEAAIEAWNTRKEDSQ